MKNETWQRNSLYAVYGLLKFSWSDTCWERGIWKPVIAPVGLGHLLRCFRYQLSEMYGYTHSWGIWNSRDHQLVLKMTNKQTSIVEQLLGASRVIPWDDDVVDWIESPETVLSCLKVIAQSTLWGP